MYHIDEAEGASQQESLSRMLSLAIIPGHHISSISVAKGKSSNEALTDPSALKHAQHKNQHKNHQKSHEDHQHKNYHDDQHENHDNQHENYDHQHENHHDGDLHHVGQHEDQNDDDQHKDQNDDNQHEDQNDRQLGNKNAIDVFTEECGQTRKDSHTPQKHLTLQ